MALAGAAALMSVQVAMRHSFNSFIWGFPVVQVERQGAVRGPFSKPDDFTFLVFCLAQLLDRADLLLFLTASTHKKQLYHAT
jgi:hypothetical protein